jgi:ATP-dependent protease ClpP protease subunit
MCCLSNNSSFLIGSHVIPYTQIHQPQGGTMGSSVEVKIQATELNRTMRVVQRFYAEYTGQVRSFLLCS